MSDLVAWQDNFEAAGKPNGSKYWMESDVMSAFDYHAEQSWKNVRNRAIQACVSLGLPIEQHFVPAGDGTTKLTRFACYLLAMNGDPRKQSVASAQIYFAALAETFQRTLDHSEGVERVLVRDELSDGQKSLASTANARGVRNYAFFHNAGYMGMYNMTTAQLEKFKHLPEGQKLMDCMGKEELAANLFRITQTEAKIKRAGSYGQRQLEAAARDVGQTVRETMIQLGNEPPERLPLAEPIRDVKRALKQASKRLRQIDAKKS